MSLRAKTCVDVCIVSPVGAARPESVARGAVRLNVPMIKQEQTQWCWAACADMIIHYYGNAATTQCDLANRAFVTSSCCAIPDSGLCNQPLTDAKISQLFAAQGLRSSYTRSVMAFGLLDVEIGSNRPVEVGLSWTNGGGHVALVIETFQASGRQALTVNDPSYGQGTVFYSELLTAYGRGVWDATWSGIQP